jgi:hypothetical protein
MKKVDLVAVVLFAAWLASLAAAAKGGHGFTTYGFFTGG